jgi:hypothetical protein
MAFYSSRGGSRLRSSFTHEPDDLVGDGAGSFFGHIVPTASKHTTPHIRRD